LKIVVFKETTLNHFSFHKFCKFYRSTVDKVNMLFMAVVIGYESS